MTSFARRAALLLLIGCGGRTSARSSSGEATIDGAVTSQLEGGRGDATSGSPDASLSGEGTLDAGASEGGTADVQDGAAGLTQGPTVWIGQSDLIVTYPPGYDGGLTTPNPSTYPRTSPEKVVLILNAAANLLVGTITFGDVTPPPLATDPTQRYPPEPTAFVNPNGQLAPFGGSIDSNLVSQPFPGFSYSLVSSSLSGSLLDLAFVPSELFQRYCALQHSPPEAGANLQGGGITGGGNVCVCDGGACGAETSPIRRFDLTVNGNTMQGQLSWPSAGWLAGTADIRLQRVQ